MTQTKSFVVSLKKEYKQTGEPRFFALELLKENKFLLYRQIQENENRDYCHTLYEYKEGKTKAKKLYAQPICQADSLQEIDKIMEIYIKTMEKFGA